METRSTALALSGNGGIALLGSSDGSTCSYEITSQETIVKSNGDGVSINDILSWENNNKNMSIIALANGEVAVLEDGKKRASFTEHAGPAMALALHPSGDILASVGVDKSFVLYDLARSEVIYRIFTDSGQSLSIFTLLQLLTILQS